LHPGSRCLSLLFFWVWWGFPLQACLCWINGPAFEHAYTHPLKYSRRWRLVVLVLYFEHFSPWDWTSSVGLWARWDWLGATYVLSEFVSGTRDFSLRVSLDLFQKSMIWSFTSLRVDYARRMYVKKEARDVSIICTCFRIDRRLSSCFGDGTSGLWP